MSDELKPCPFCGQQNINLEIQGSDYFCYCGDCGTENTAGYDKASAVRFWNTRPVEDAQAAEIERLHEIITDAVSILSTLPLSWAGVHRATELLSAEDIIWQAREYQE